MAFATEKRGYLFLTALAALLAALISLRQTLTTKPERPPPVIGKNNTVLFVANVEHGLSNVHVATVFSLLEHHPEITVHFASWTKIRPKIERISTHARKLTPQSRDVVFHELPPPNFSDAAGKTSLAIMQPPGIEGLKALNDDMALFISPWTVEDHLKIHDAVRDLIRDVDPALVVLDMFVRPGMDATRGDNRLHAILSPNVLADIFIGDQSWLGGFWKYPAIGSGHSFPVAWRDIPSNIYQTAAFVWGMLYNTELNNKRKSLASRGLKDPIDFFNIHQPGSGAFITQDTAGASIPIDYVPPNVTVTGPIAISVASAAEQDSELAAWLERAPTVMVNLGSMMEYDAARARPMAAALKTLLERTGVQALWKLNRAEDLKDEDWRPLVEEFIANDRLRVSKWLTVDPAALLETGNIVASVHHGGANCYHEAIAAGVPHLILPGWLDLYNYAARVEAIDIGVWGNKKTAPGFSVDELSSAFLKLVDGGPASVLMKENAKKISRTLVRPGRDVAADEIARLAAWGH
ncbi:UDP-glucoronosyl and UDP-glucosyl transferase family protein [Colletotrichum incanum]|nr:UDP-glucoronosyl and UDP-glucosyl transferase family protein [Colletotrichum incanum]